MSVKHYLFFLLLGVSVTSVAVTPQISAPEPQTGTIIGTVTDVNDGTVPGATVALEGPSLSDPKRVETNDNGFFQLDHVNPEMPYHITVSASGFADWSSPEVILQPGQHMDLTDIRLRIAAAVTTVNAVFSTEELAREQESVEEKQRVLGFIPNFYAVYDRNAVPLTPMLKFRLALKTTTDPITVLGSAFLAGLDQAGNAHHFGQGGEAYGQRFGAHYANGLIDIMVGGAILPTILHQIRATFTKVQAQRNHACSTLSLRRLSAREITDAGSRTIQAWGLSGLWRHLQRLLFGVGSRPGADVFDHLY